MFIIGFGIYGIEQVANQLSKALDDEITFNDYPLPWEYDDNERIQYCQRLVAREGEIVGDFAFPLVNYVYWLREVFREDVRFVYVTANPVVVIDYLSSDEVFRRLSGSGQTNIRTEQQALNVCLYYTQVVKQFAYEDKFGIIVYDPTTESISKLIDKCLVK